MITVPIPEGGLSTRPIGLDFTAVMLAGLGSGVDLRLLAAVLPRVEAAILAPPDAMIEEDADAD